MIVSFLASRARGFCLPVLSGTALCLSSAMAFAAPAAAPVTTGGDILRVCAANQPPYSIKGGGGFENKIALAVAEAMGRQVQFVWSSRPAIYIVQEYLNKNLCDVVIGLDTSDPRVLTTKPYYRAGYVFVTRTPTISTFIRERSAFAEVRSYRRRLLYAWRRNAEKDRQI